MTRSFSSALLPVVSSSQTPGGRRNRPKTNQLADSLAEKSSIATGQVRAFAGWPGTSATLYLQGECTVSSASHTAVLCGLCCTASQHTTLSVHAICFVHSKLHGMQLSSSTPILNTTQYSRLSQVVITPVGLTLWLLLCRGGWLLDAPGLEGAFCYLLPASQALATNGIHCLIHLTPYCQENIRPVPCSFTVSFYGVSVNMGRSWRRGLGRSSQAAA